ncbi:MAG TPA: hypothetical protein VND97_01180 [Beijerinckiaceae bacterium]|nr:hypothetical protein [Beijerinckiaceae bacterium]
MTHLFGLPSRLPRASEPIDVPTDWLENHASAARDNIILARKTSKSPLLLTEVRADIRHPDVND